MEWLHHLVAALFALTGAACVLAVALQLPGGWLLLFLALVIEIGDVLYLPADRDATFGWKTLALVAGLAVVGEIVEFLAGAYGVEKGGGTRRGMWGAVAGGIVGFFVFSPLFAFLPLFAPLCGALLGTFAGAFLAEYTGAKARVGAALAPALWATAGRVIGATVKVAITSVMWGVLVLRAFWP